MPFNHNFWKQVQEQQMSPRKPNLNTIYKTIVERSKSSVADTIIQTIPTLKSGAGKAGAIRLQPVKKGIEVTEQEFIEVLKKIGFEYVKTIPPKTPESKSSKYDTYEIKDESGVVHFIVIGGGASSNKGIEYERQLLDEISEALHTKKPHHFIDVFTAFAHCPPIVDVKSGFNKRVQRQLTGEPKNVGPIIADITLVDQKGTGYHISLKEKNGVTIANNGIGNTFTEHNGIVKFNGDPRINSLFTGLKLDTDLACQGLEAFLAKKPFAKQDIELKDYKEQIVLNYLGSAIDYGYYYARNLGNGEFELEDLTTLDKLKQFIGTIENIVIKYPYYIGEGMLQKRKHISIEIITDEHVFNFDIRNASGGVIPKQINLVKKS